jgi:enoyl-CoA hydratase
VVVTDPRRWETERCPELELGLAVMASNDAKEGPRAFLDKREPHFTGT